MHFLFNLVFKSLPVGFIGLAVWEEWQKSMFPLDFVAHYAHIGGALGAALYLAWIHKDLKFAQD